MASQKGKSFPKPSQKFSFNVTTYLRDHYQNRHGLSPVYHQIYLKGKLIRFNTSAYVPVDMWDPVTTMVKRNYPGATDLNLLIKNSKARLTAIFVRYRLQNKDLTPELLRSEYLRPSLNIDFLTWMEEKIKERKGEVTESTIRQHKAHLNKLKEFQAFIAFSELNDEFFIRYQRWLKTTKSNGQNTRFNSIKTIRTYLNLAKKGGLIDKNPLDSMPVKKAKTHRGYLEEDELKILIELYHKNWLPDTYQRVLRHYLFGCMTGARISDIERIRMSDIIVKTLVIVPYKTANVNAQTIQIPLNKLALQLVKDEEPYRMDGLIFNMFSEARTRLYLKDIFGHAKIKKKLSFHSSRHTFATIFLRRTKNIAALQRILGHAKIEQTMVYAHLISEDLEKEMKAMDDFYTK